MSEHVTLIDTFYRAFKMGDAETMALCYHPEATFTDPVFDLAGDEIGDMWRMFCASGTLLTLAHTVVGEDSGVLTAHWEPRYEFGPKRRPVHNRIDSRFEFEDNLISRHRDDFDLAAWAKQALGLPGALFGRTSWLQSSVRSQAAAQLAHFRST